jgi:hypothetical protein
MKKLTLIVLAAAAVLRPMPAAQSASPPPLATAPIASPAGTADVMAPQLTVQGDRVILSWLEMGHHATLKYSERTASGWSAARTVVSGENVMANSADVPSVHALPDGRLAALWLEKIGLDPEAYNLNLSISSDKGQTWAAAASRPHRDQTQTQHGFPSIFATGTDGFAVVWLDGRDTAGGKGAMALRASVYRGREAVASDMVVAPRVCDCCPTAAVSTAEGALVAFRNRTADEIRDIYVSRFDGSKWSAPAVVHNDGWKINGCPINGPALSARGRNVAIGWFTAASGAGRAFLAFSTDAGRTFSAPIRVDEQSSLGRVQVALLADGSAAVSWIEFGKGISELRARRIAANGARSAAVALALGIGTQFPRMVAARNELVFAWTENSRGTTQLRTARAKAQ